MPPDPAPMAAFGSGERVVTMPAALRDDHHYLIRLLDRQQSPEGPTMSGLAAAFPSGGWRFRAHRRLGRIR